ncbi:MAG: hypothetical protein HY809_08765 [Nitrospirae bacterium]|nr:hypothetical protein [Nitrospirota bacterium]
MSDTYDIRAVILQVIQDQHPKNPTDMTLQQGSVLEETKRRIGIKYNEEKERAILTTWHDLFRTGYLAWGLNISNPNPPFFHVTTNGRRALASLNRDPGNPDGYLKHLYFIATLQPVEKSYLEEGLKCFVSGFYKASAVMIGASTESMILDIRDCIVQKLTTIGHPIPKKLTDWKIKTILDAAQTFFDMHKHDFAQSLREEYEAYWAAFIQQIRSARNDAGHPTSVDPVTSDTVHASLLIFPELAKLTEKLRTWVTNEFKYLT